jgi:hypothetical protein
VKPAKATEPKASSPTKPSRRSSTWSVGISKPSFLSRNPSESKPAGPVPTRSLAASSRQPEGDGDCLAKNVNVPKVPTPDCTDLVLNDQPEASINSLPNEAGLPERPSTSRNSSSQSTGSSSQSCGGWSQSTGESSQSNEEEDTCEETLDTFDNLTVEETHSRASSSYSRDVSSVFSSDSASIYSNASSTYSSGASTYSYDEDAEVAFDSRMSGRLQYQQRTRNVPTTQREPQDAASHERSVLARKAAMFKNSRLPPQLPLFSTSLPTWSMICRAAQASEDCYGVRALTRRGLYTPADTSKDIKAMIIDEQLIDESQLIIVSIRGTEFQCLADWSVNKAGNPTKPIGFLDDEENACHTGFLQVAKAMAGPVAAQLQQHPAFTRKPSLLFTGHSAGGAVAAILYSHMLSISITSDLTALASQFSSVNCVTFGAPPVSLTPLPRRESGSGVFLSFANEGDPVLRLCHAAYLKSLVKLMTASPPSSTAAPPLVKVVRHSRGTRVIREIRPAAPPTPWVDLPMWPTPPATLTNAGDVILLRGRHDGSASASQVTPEDLKDVIFSDLAQHTMGMYMRRVKDVAFAAMMGNNVN